MQLAGKDLFLVCEAGEATGSAAQLVPMAVGAIVTGVAASNATAAPRILDQALESANRVIADAKRFNPLVADVLVSAAVVLRDGQGLHYASIGSNAIYLRAGGTCRRLNEPESEARHLVSEGITSAPLPGSNDEASRPSVGLGLPPAVFRIRQSSSFMEPDDYLLVVIGGRAACRLGPVHIETTSPVGDASRTAERLLRQAGMRPEDGSAVCAAHRAHDVMTDVSGLMGDSLAADHEPLHVPWKAIGGGLSMLALVLLGFYLFGGDGGNKQRHNPVLSPTTLLTPKGDEPDRRPPPTEHALVLPDVEVPPLDLGFDPGASDVATKPTDMAAGGERDAGREVIVPPRPTAAEREKARLRREARALRRSKRHRRSKRQRLAEEARAREEAAMRETQRPDVTSVDYSSDAIQVMDFTKPEPDARPEDAGPSKRPFPTAKLVLPDLVAEPADSAPPDINVPRSHDASDATGSNSARALSTDEVSL